MIFKGWIVLFEAAEEDEPRMRLTSRHSDDVMSDMSVDDVCG
jgi:hypothetical protein